MNHIRGLWLESLGPSAALANPAELRAAMHYCQGLGVSDLYLQVYREGRAWFRSTVAGQEHLLPVLSSGHEPLRAALDLAASCGIRVHAWINAFNLGLNERAPILERSGPEVLLTDNCGTRLDVYSSEGKPPDARAEYFQLDAPKLWLDPSSPHVKQHLETVVSELFEAYPQFCGLHLDFFRYPYFLPMQPSSRIGCGFETGYGQDALQRFAEASGHSDGFKKDERGALRPIDETVSLAWDRWRRAEVGSYTNSFRKIIGAEKTLSVAAIAWADRAFFTAYQNWRQWLSEDSIDQACLMAYTADDELFSYLVHQAAAFQSAHSIVLGGAGVYLHRDAAQLAGQMHAASLAGAKGSLIFSYENLRKKGIDSSTLTDLLGQRRRI
ncbi:MAG: family 10 glycosylhydrolase [Deltaproteobacteria bacterium]|nr:family 10 glycosylhydrolase [Deltaproteobacteria bacterium]